ncbi:pxf-1 [Pristionchus pacificus]|nr:pxf-1 [Pristionchus pacificus]
MWERERNSSRSLSKLRRYCRDLRNFNSMFAIMSGLDKPAVRRLHASWDRVGSKYVRWLEEVHTLVDPSRNMSRYRQHLATVSHDPPVIPIYPVLKKDLTFMHEGNSTYTEKLINFEKLRLIARAIRAVGKLSSAPYEIAAMAERSGGALNDALLHMNTFEYASGTVATMRKSAKGATQPRKKVYEQALMVRKVKTYLAELKVVDNESELDSLSLEIEPSTTSNGNGEKATGSGGPPQRRPISNRPPSPTPSSLSSQSNARVLSLSHPREQLEEGEDSLERNSEWRVHKLFRRCCRLCNRARLKNVVHPHLLTLLTNRILLVDHQEWDKLRPLMIHEYSIHLDYPREAWFVSHLVMVIVTASIPLPPLLLSLPIRPLPHLIIILHPITLFILLLLFLLHSLLM